LTATLYRDGAFADGRSDRLELGVSILVIDGVIAWIRPTDDEGPLPAAAGEPQVVDASGSTIVPGMVDAHSHLTLPGGAHWIDRIDDPAERLLAAAEANARLLTGAGIRWARDVGSPTATDPSDGRVRALALGVRDRWRGQPGYPNVRAAGSWLDRGGYIKIGRSTSSDDPATLLATAIRQLDDGADFLKLYLDGPERDQTPWTAAEVTPVVRAAHARGAKVTAHAGNLPGARVAVEAGMDCIEHGFGLDADVAAAMAARGTVVVSTLSVFRSWAGFATTTSIDRFASSQGGTKVLDSMAGAMESIRIAHAAGVAIASGTDFGGGSTRANQLAWEVESLVACGLEPWEALGAATWRGGELLSEPDAGIVREGGPADFSLVHGDPLSDPTALWRIWHVSWAGGDRA
jgi:imidazolonepropionase-like amidohydrolase